MIDTKLLRQKILDLAIRGKLVPQDPNDEPASVLLEKIRAEKAELIKQGKIKKPKQDSFIFKNPSDNRHYENVGGKVVYIEDQITFDLPHGWSIVRIKDCLRYEQPQEYIVSSTDYNDDNTTPVLTAGKSFILGYTNETTGIFTNTPCIIFDDFTTDVKFVDFKFKVKSSAMKILNRVEQVAEIRFMFYLLSTIEVNSETHKRFWLSEYENKPIALPPLKEQREIIKVVEAQFELISQIEAEQAELSDLAALAKSKILDLAMRGKLVPQDPNDEPASELLARVSTSHKPHYENLPAGWAFATLNEVGKVCMCKRIFKEETHSTGDIPFYKIGTFGKIPDAFITRELYLEYKAKYPYPRKGAILLSASGTIGRTVVFDGTDAYFQDSNIVWIDNDEKNVISEYLKYFYSAVNWRTADGTTIARLYNDYIRKAEICIPPLAEQKRIVEAIEAAFALIDSMSE